MPEEEYYLQIRPDLEALFSGEPERKRLQLEVARRLLAYFDTVYQVLEYSHPSTVTPIVIWMTQDKEKPQNPFQGPIPMLVRASDQEFIKKWGMYDYREPNDSRGGVYPRNDNTINPAIIEILSSSNVELSALVQAIDARMKKINDPPKRHLIVNILQNWEQRTGYINSPFVTEASSHNYDDALCDLVRVYQEKLNKTNTL
jgi:hypothetical protein